MAIDSIDTLVDFAFNAESSGVPSNVMDFQCLRLLDHLACVAAGYDALGVSESLALAQRYSGCQEATVLGSNLQLAAGQAAFVNAVRSRALDFCDVISPGWHPSSSDLPVAIAMAELAVASGKDMLAALAIGQDIGQRINLASQANGFFYRGFDSNVLGLFSGVTIASRLMRLSREQFQHAMGLAFDFGIGTFQHYQDKALAVRIGQGLVARHVIEAALLAKSGVTGSRCILEGENGFFNLYAPSMPDTSVITKNLGHHYFGSNDTCFKIYPHCSILLALSDALLSTRPRLRNLNLEESTFLLETSPVMRMVCGAPYNPSSTAQIDAQFNARYVVANALLRGRVTPWEFTAEAALESETMRLAKDIELIEVPEFERFDQCRLTINDPKGKNIIIDASFGRGWPENPVEREDLLKKFYMCCEQSACEGMRRKRELIAEVVMTIEHAPTIHVLVNSLDSNV